MGWTRSTIYLATAAACAICGSKVAGGVELWRSNRCADQPPGTQTGILNAVSMETNRRIAMICVFRPPPASRMAAYGRQRAFPRDVPDPLRPPTDVCYRVAKRRRCMQSAAALTTCVVLLTGAHLGLATAA